MVMLSAGGGKGDPRLQKQLQGTSTFHKKPKFPETLALKRINMWVMQFGTTTEP